MKAVYSMWDEGCCYDLLTCNVLPLAALAQPPPMAGFARRSRLRREDKANTKCELASLPLTRCGLWLLLLDPPAARFARCSLYYILWYYILWYNTILYYGMAFGRTCLTPLLQLASLAVLAFFERTRLMPCTLPTTLTSDYPSDHPFYCPSDHPSDRPSDRPSD